MPEDIVGSAEGHDAAVNFDAPEVVPASSERQELADAVASAERKVEKQEAHLDGAREALKEAQAALAAHDGGKV